MKVCRKANFNAAHRLYRPDWSDEKNNEVFEIELIQNSHLNGQPLEVSIIIDLNPSALYVLVEM